jgi:hypothetical protein
MQSPSEPHCFYGRTLSRTVPACCTCPLCRKCHKYWGQQNIGARQDFTDFCQTLAVNISAHRHPFKIGENKKWSPSLSNISFYTHDLQNRGHHRDLCTLQRDRTTWWRGRIGGEGCTNVLIKVNWGFLSTPTFCWRQYFVDGNIFATRIFCRRQYFVDTNILPAPIFCRCQCFVGANILPAQIFCLCLDFKDDYLLNILLIIVFCVYHWLLLICQNLLGFDR